MNVRELIRFILVGWVIFFFSWPKPASAEPRAIIEATHQENGIGTLRIRFVGVSDEFSVERVRLDLRQLSPVAPATKAQSTRIETVSYDVLVPVASLDELAPKIVHPLDLLHDPAEPYALARLCLWLDRPDSQVTLAVRIHFIGPGGDEIKLTREPEWVEVRLRNVAQVQARPAERTGSCKD